MGFNLNIIRHFTGGGSMRIGELRGGGVILSYRCTNSCGHCLVCGGPKRENRWLTVAELDDIFSAIKMLGPYAEMHIGGGEAFLNPERTIAAVESAARNGVRLSYVETNGFWGRAPEKYLPVLHELKTAGLRTLLISVSPFHSEFITTETTEAAIALTREVFGHGGAFVWVPEFLEILGGFDKKRPVKLAELPEPVRRMVPDLYYMIPGGRAGYIDPPVTAMRRASDYFMTDCERELLGASHFHIDCYGLYMPGGLCAGIAPCSYKELGGPISLDDKPALRSLLNEGVRGLYNMAKDAGYEELPGGYAGKCHLCVDIRGFLHRSGGAYPELAPAEFYSSL